MTVQENCWPLPLSVCRPRSTQAAAPITGRWVTQSKDGVVEIYQCGAQICGRLAKFLVMPPAGAGAKGYQQSQQGRCAAVLYWE